MPVFDSAVFPGAFVCIFESAVYRGAFCVPAFESAVFPGEFCVPVFEIAVFPRAPPVLIVGLGAISMSGSYLCVSWPALARVLLDLAGTGTSNTANIYHFYFCIFQVYRILMDGAFPVLGWAWVPCDTGFR